MKLQANVGNLDMIIRVGVGLVLLMLMAVGEIGAWGVLGLLLALTGVARWCALYALLGIDTLKHTAHRT